MDSSQLLFTVADRSYFALLKKEIHALALQLGFSNEKTGKVDLVVAEMVSNLVKHANGGHLLVKQIKDPQKGEGLELVSIDSGKGIPDLKRMMQDGVSTKNTLVQVHHLQKPLPCLWSTYNKSHRHKWSPPALEQLKN